MGRKLRVRVPYSCLCLFFFPPVLSLRGFLPFFKVARFDPTRLIGLPGDDKAAESLGFGGPGIFPFFFLVLLRK